MYNAFAPSFIKSADKPDQFPADDGYEVAIAGRSNSGKSTAINAMTKRRSLARTSKTPGRPQLINIFLMDEERRLVDLPGYGYAKVAISMQKHWRQLLECYFSERQSLVGLFITIDIRRGPNELDHVMLDWAENSDIPVATLLTKADKLSKSACIARQRETKQCILTSVPSVIFSATKGTGVEEAVALMLGWLNTNN